MREPKSKNKKGCLRIVAAVIVVLIGLAFLGIYSGRKRLEANEPQKLRADDIKLEAQNILKEERIRAEEKSVKRSNVDEVFEAFDPKNDSEEKKIEDKEKLAQQKIHTKPSANELNEAEVKRKEDARIKKELIERKAVLAKLKKELAEQEAKNAKARHSAKLNRNWHYSSASDSMSKGKLFSAVTQSSNTVEFKFPYKGAQRGRLTLRTHPRHGKDVIFSIQKGQILNDLTGGSTMLVRFDENKAVKFKYVGASDHNSTVVFIQDYHKFVSKMLKAKRVRISVNVYQEGSPVFDFNVADFSTVEYLQQKK